MIIINYIRKILTRYCLILSVTLIFLDIFALYVGGGTEHLQFRHMFLSNDLLGMFANVLYWSMLLIPIAVDISDDMGSFGICIISRISVFKYAAYKLLGITAYCTIFFAGSYLISFITAKIGKVSVCLNKNSRLLFFLLLFLSIIALQAFVILTRLFKSSFAAAGIYIFLAAFFQSPQIQKTVSIAHLLYKADIYAVYGILFCIILLFFFVWLYLMRKTDFIGIKKGASV